MQKLYLNKQGRVDTPIIKGGSNYIYNKLSLIGKEVIYGL